MLPPPSLLQLIAIALLAHLALTGTRITTSLYALSLHATAFTVGTLIAVFALFPMLLAVPTGRLIDRAGTARPLVAGCAAMVVGCALAALEGGLGWLYIAAALIGTGLMVVQVAVQHAVGIMSSVENRGTNYSWLSIGFSISGFCGPVMAGLLIDFTRYGIAWLVFCASAAAALGLAVHARTGTLSHPSPLREKSRAGATLELLRDPALRGIYIVGLLLAAAWDMFTFMLPLRGAQLALSASTIGFILGAFSLATFLVRLAMPWLIRRFNEWQILQGALLLASLCYAAFPFLSSAWGLTLVGAALGLAVGASQPNMLALLHRTAPPGRAGEAMGIRVTMGNGSQVVLPLAFGALGAALGLTTVFVGMALMIAFGLRVARRQQRMAAPALSPADLGRN